LSIFVSDRRGKPLMPYCERPADGVVQDINRKHRERLARSDGYDHALTRELLSGPGRKVGVSRRLI
jgi:hypothetical protein